MLDQGGYDIIGQTRCLLHEDVNFAAKIAFQLFLINGIIK